jgi:hypothetical protein
MAGGYLFIVLGSACSILPKNGKGARGRAARTIPPLGRSAATPHCDHLHGGGRGAKSRIPFDHHWPLSIDENRQIFAPEIWDESEESPEAKARGRIKQVWFPGVHSDIGGGYPETGLSDLALEWMIKEAMGARVDQRRCTRTKDPCSSKNASSKNREVA